MTQSTLFNFQEKANQDSSSYSLYKELSDAGYVDNHKRQILEALWDLKSHSSDEIVLAGGKQYNARVLELRRAGWNIVSERSTSSSHKFFFRLLSKDRRMI